MCTACVFATLKTRLTDRIRVLEGSKSMVSCHEVLLELSNYIDNEVDPELRVAIEEHLRQCHRCSVLLDSTRKMLYFVADERIFEVPVGYSEHLSLATCRHDDLERTA